MGHLLVGADALRATEEVTEVTENIGIRVGRAPRGKAAVPLAICRRHWTH
jgi:hypothetical protein